MSTQATLEKRVERETPPTERTRCGRCYRPQVDILERPDELIVMADMPGVNARDIDIHFEQGTLAIYGRVQPRQREDLGYLLHEYGIGDFQRTFQVSEAVDAGRIHAELADGVLTLHLPKTEAAKPRKITVKAT